MHGLIGHSVRWTTEAPNTMAAENLAKLTSSAYPKSTSSYKNHTNQRAASLHSASTDAALQVPAALWGKLPRMPNTSSPPSAAAPASLIDSPQAAWRLLTTLGLVVLGNSSMYVVSVVLPAVQAEFGVGRADASLPTR